MDYDWEPQMEDIYGGKREADVRLMIKAGAEWFHANPDAKPVWRGFEILNPTNDAAKDLFSAVGGQNGGAKGYEAQKMLALAVRSAAFIEKHGWDHFSHTMEQKKDN